MRKKAEELLQRAIMINASKEDIQLSTKKMIYSQTKQQQ